MRLAVYHCSIKIIGRGGIKPRFAVASAAYRSGTKMTNEYDGVTHGYTRKQGVVYSEIMLLPHAPEKFSERSGLWNSVERIEKSGNAQLAREVEVSLPKELDRESQMQLIKDYVNGCFVSAGMCADFSIHDRQDGNPHAHIMLTMRSLEQSGEWGAKCRKEYIPDKNGNRLKKADGRYKSRRADTTDWNSRDKAEEWRKAWADCVNHVLAEQGFHETVDHRSYKRQGIEKIPTVHMGGGGFADGAPGHIHRKGNGEQADHGTEPSVGRNRTKVKGWDMEL